MNTSIDTRKPIQSSIQRQALQPSNGQLGIQRLPINPLEEVYSQSSMLSTLFQSVLESLMDGILILTEQGKLIDANHCALQICRQLIQDLPPTGEVPQQIWQICEALIDSYSLFPDHTVTIEDEIEVGTCNGIRIRARWIDFHQSSRPYLMVILEDRHQSLKNIALAEAHKYGLTAREAEVWLLRRANYTYKAIAAELHIALDTVKKHVKSIHAKRDAFLWANES